MKLRDFVQMIFSYRMIITLIALVNVTVMYGERNGLFVAMGYMRCPANVSMNETANYTRLCYEWSNNVRATLIGMVFVGFAISQTFSGWLTAKLGLKQALIMAQIIVFITTLIIPMAAEASWILLTVVRLITGLAQGFIWPFIQTTVAFWSPENERAFHLSVMSSGICIGPFLAMIISGPLCELQTKSSNRLLEGWAIYFYVLSLLGLIVLVLDFIFLSSDPLTNRFVSENEKQYISSNKKGRPTQENTHIKIPFKQILSSVPFYAFCAGVVLSDVGLFATWTITPDYIRETFDSSPIAISLATSIPYLTNLLATLLSGFLAMYLVDKKKLTKTASTKLFHTIGCVGSGLCLFPITYLKPDQLLIAGVCMSIGFGLHGIIIGAGYTLNCNDFAGVFAGIVYTFGNCLSNALGATLSFLTDTIKDSTQGQSNGWRNVLYVFSGSYFLSALLFGLLSSGQLQDWGTVKDEETVHVELTDSNSNIRLLK